MNVIKKTHKNKSMSLFDLLWHYVLCRLFIYKFKILFSSFCQENEPRTNQIHNTHSAYGMEWRLPDKNVWVDWHSSKINWCEYAQRLGLHANLDWFGDHLTVQTDLSMVCSQQHLQFAFIAWRRHRIRWIITCTRSHARESYICYYLLSTFSVLLGANGMEQIAPVESTLRLLVKYNDKFLFISIFSNTHNKRFCTWTACLMSYK